MLNIDENTLWFVPEPGETFTTTDECDIQKLVRDSELPERT
jgi:hypothetical protein